MASKQNRKLVYGLIAVILILTVTIGLLIIGLSGSLGGMGDFDSDGVPNIFDPDDDNDGVPDGDDYDPFDPEVTDAPSDDDDDDDEEEEPSDWITIQLFVEEYDDGSPDTPGNPSYYILSVSGDTFSYYEWVAIDAVTTPPYEWLAIVHKQTDGSVFDPQSMWGELSYLISSDTWIDSSDPNYLEPIASGTWNRGNPSLVWSGQIYIGGISGHYVGMDFYVHTIDWSADWNYYILFQVP